MDHSLSEASSKEDMTPLMCVHKQICITKSHCMDCTPETELRVLRNPCGNMKLMGSNMSLDNQGKIVDDTSRILASCAESKHIFTLNKFCSSDNSDEEESPLAALASRHLKNKVLPSDRCSNMPFCVREEEFVDYTESDNCNKSLRTDGCIADGAEGQHMYWKLSQHGSVKRKEELFREDISCVSKDSELNEDERDSDDSIYSPLVTLADKYLKMEDMCENSLDYEFGKCGSSSDSVQSLLSNSVKQGQNQVHSPFGRNSNVLELSPNLPDIGVTSITDNFFRLSANQTSKIQEEKNGNIKIIKEECIAAPKDVQSSTDVRKSVFDYDILANKETNMLDRKEVSSLSDLAFHHLSKSASCRVQTNQQFVPKKFYSDSGISKSMPSGFVIPFLSKSENDSFSSESNTFGEKLMNLSDVQGVVESDVSVESCEDWVIDLTNALRDPELRIPHNTPDNKFSTTIIHIDNTEFQEESMPTTSCHLDASEILKMKFSYSKKRCSPFGRVICRAWRHLSGPFIPRTKQSVGTVSHFSFDEPSPDDSILIHLGEKS